MQTFKSPDGFRFEKANPFRPLCCGCFFEQSQEPCPEFEGVVMCARPQGWPAVILQKLEDANV